MSDIVARQCDYDYDHEYTREEREQAGVCQR